MRITWHGHSCFCLRGTRRILIDPFVPAGTVPKGADIVAVTHGHDDHFGDVVSLKTRTVAVKEIAEYLREQGVPAESMNLGGTISLDDVSFTMVPALHSSCIEAAGVCSYGGVAAGFIVGMDGTVVYHAGDTALFSDMKLIGELYRPDVAFLPIGGKYTMGPREAMIAAQFIGAPLVIPMHYDTWPKIKQDPVSFKNAIERTTDLKVAVLAPGESIEVQGRCSGKPC
jgi:L-ascorbate metabolism protein UlaG (beta-lactamase superfamily)